MSTLVTGASGFIGRHLADALTEGGREVVGVARRAPPGWRGRFVTADLRDGASVKAAFDELRPTEVVHLARSGPEGSANVAAAITATPSVTRSLFASSFVVGDRTFAERATPALRAYAAGKSTGEERVLARLPEACILRVASTWGPGQGPPFDAFFGAIARGRYRHLPSSDVRKRLAYVGNVAFQITRLLDAPAERVSGRRFYLADYRATTVRELANLAARALGRGEPRSWPALVGATAGRVGDVLAAAGWPAPLTSTRLANLGTSSVWIPFVELERLTGPLPWTVEDGVQRTVAAMREAA